MSDNHSEGPNKSHAHRTDPLKTGRLAESSQTLNQQFVKARDFQKEQSATRQSASLSHAKTIQMDEKANKLDGASRNLRTQFERAKTAQIEQKTTPISERPGSPMVQKDRPIHRPSPTGPMREGADRQSYNDRLAAERAKTVSEAIKVRHEQQKSVDLTHGRDTHNDGRSR